MKRKFTLLILCIGLLLSIAVPGNAESEPPYIIDNAYLLLREEETSLEEKAQTLRQEYGMDIVIVTVESLDGATPQDYADDYFDENGYGYGPDRSGVLLLLSMEERDWYISTSGDAIYALTDYGIQQSMELPLTYLSHDGYYLGFDTWLDALPTYFDAYRNGAPIDGYADDSGDYYHGDQESVVYYEEKHSPNLFLAMGLGLFFALLAMLGMLAAMNTKRQKYSAGDYLQAGSYRLRTQQDFFLYSNVSKTARPSESSGSSGHSSSGGGSSVHHSSSGRSHGGGGGKF